MTSYSVYDVTTPVKIVAIGNRRNSSADEVRVGSHITQNSRILEVGHPGI